MDWPWWFDSIATDANIEMLIMEEQYVQWFK
jgi:hypothetical protein